MKKLLQVMCLTVYAVAMSLSPDTIANEKNKLKVSYNKGDKYSFQLTYTGHQGEWLSNDKSFEFIREFEIKYKTSNTAQGRAKAAFELINQLKHYIRFKTKYFKQPFEDKSKTYLFISIPTEGAVGDMGSFDSPFIYPGDLEEVLPLLYKLLMKNSKKLDEQTVAQIPGGSGVGGGWPRGEDWYDGWAEWVNEELIGMCTGMTYNHCTSYGIYAHDKDGDGENDFACGMYYGYNGTDELLFHCVDRNDTP